MYGVTSVICAMDTKGINVTNGQALNDTVNVIKWIFTPINAMIVSASIGRTLGKAKEKEIDTDKLGKRLIIIFIAIIVVIVFEKNYIKNFITGVLG